MGGVEERFGRNAPAVQTDSTQARVALDNNDFLTKVSGVKRGGVSTGSGANNNDFRF
jgi:hypothetical protein